MSMFVEGNVEHSKPLTLKVIAADPDDSSMKYQWTVEGAGCTGSIQNAQSASATWTVPAGMSNRTKCSFKVLVTDGRGGEAKGTVVASLTLNNSIKAQIKPASSFDSTPPTSSITPGGGTVSLDGNPDFIPTITCKDAGTGCKRIVYTLDGSKPSFDPPNGVIVDGNTASVPLIVFFSPAHPYPEHHVRFASEDNAGNRELPQSVKFVVE